VQVGGDRPEFGPKRARLITPGRMDPLVRASLLIRTVVRKGHGLALSGALGAYVIAGGATTPMGPELAVAVALWLALLAARLRAKLEVTGEARFRVDVELGMLLAVGLDAALLRFEGGLSGAFSPAVYVLVALVAAFARPAAGLVVVTWVVLLEAAVRRF